MLFQSFQALLSSAQTSKINLVVTAVSGGRLSVLLLANSDAKGEGQEALNRPLSVTATPEELDAEFATLLQGHASTRRSLAEQLEAEATILKGAAAASATRASKKLTEGKAKRSTAQAGQGDATPPEDDDEDAVPPDDGGGAASAAGPAPEAGPTQDTSDGAAQQGGSLFDFKT